MYKRNEVYWVKIGNDSFAALEPFFKYYKKMGFLDQYYKLDYGLDYKWVVSKKHKNEGNFTLCYSESFYKWAGLDKCTTKPEVF
jgi:hypothetical protein